MSNRACSVEGCEYRARYRVELTKPERDPVEVCRGHLMDTLKDAGFGFEGFINIIPTGGAEKEIDTDAD